MNVLKAFKENQNGFGLAYFKLLLLFKFQMNFPKIKSGVTDFVGYNLHQENNGLSDG